MIFSPRRFMTKPDQVAAGDAVMVAYLAAPYPGEKTLRVVRMNLGSLLEAMGFFAADPVQRRAGAQRVPPNCFVGTQGGPRGDARVPAAPRVGVAGRRAG